MAARAVLTPVRVRNIGRSRPGMRFGPPLTDISDEIMLAGAQSRRSGQETTEI